MRESGCGAPGGQLSLQCVGPEAVSAEFNSSQVNIPQLATELAHPAMERPFVWEKKIHESDDLGNFLEDVPVQLDIKEQNESV